MARRLSNSLETKGLERFVNDKYPTAKRPGMTPYQHLDDQFEHKVPDTAIADTFIPGVILTRAAIGKWHARWELEKAHPELRQGGNLEDAENV